ncbi:MAG: efflux RND transporter periplasmic adaptor subunit [Erysipelotrichia bacterium]|nr:efflux RND transporter periplasmic adaptor subunit [Erysipelotrichia bacterium]
MTSHGNRRIKFAISLLVMVCLITVGCGSVTTETQAPKKPAPQVEVEVAKQTDLVQALPLTGEIIAVETAKISSTVDGVIGFCGFREGDKVETGTTLIEIDRETIRAEVFSAEAALDVAKAKLADLTAGTRPEEIDKAYEAVKQFKESTEFAGKDLERIEMLVKSGALPTEELEKARVKQVGEQSKYNSAKRQFDMLKAGLTVTVIAVQKAAVKEAEAKLAMAKARLAECTIKAPFTGVVTKLLVKKGDMAAVKAPLLELSNFDSIVVRCAVPEKHSTGLTEGMTAEVNIDAISGQMFTASVARVFPELDSRMRTRTIELVFDDAKDLMPGMFARLKLVQQKLPNTISLPVQAIKNKPDGSSFVFMPQEGKAVVRPVKTGQIIDNRIQIIEGISNGDKVIVAGNEKLKDGSEIRVAGGKGPVTDKKPAGESKAAAGGEQK